MARAKAPVRNGYTDSDRLNAPQDEQQSVDRRFAVTVRQTAVISQLRIPSLTPSHTNHLFFNNLQHRVIFRYRTLPLVTW
jgi:methylphosphotriester-DNA--protein-cysteine methyltransferase